MKLNNLKQASGVINKCLNQKLKSLEQKWMKNKEIKGESIELRKEIKEKNYLRTEV